MRYLIMDLLPGDAVRPPPWRSSGQWSFWGQGRRTGELVRLWL